MATGVLGLIILAGAALTNPSIPIAALWLGGFFLLDALVNLIPLQWVKGGGSDGLHILQYLGGNNWTADMWAKTRLATAELSPQLVSDEEWEYLKPLVDGPFNGVEFDKLLALAAAERR